MKKYLLLFICIFTSGFVFSQVLETQDFNSGFPSDWGNESNASDGGWAVGTANNAGSQYWQITDPEDGSTFVYTNDDQCNCDKNEDRLILPTMDLSNETGGLLLNFDLVFGGFVIGVPELLTVEASTDGGSTWEEVASVAGSGGIEWRSESVNVSDYVGSSSVTFSLVYSDQGAWLYGVALDNIGFIVPPKNEIALTFANDYRFADISNGYDLVGQVTNLGSDRLTSFDVNINLDGVETTETITGVDVGLLESAEFSVNVPIASANEFTIDFDIANPNGELDLDDSNNSSTYEGVGVENAPSKMIFVEESTGTWCPWCPRGAVFMDKMEEEIGDVFAGVAVHVGQPTWADPMQIDGAYPTTYANLVGGFPTLLIDRNFNPGIPGTIEAMTEYGQVLATYTESRPSPIGLDVGAVIDPWSREMTIDLTATAHTNIDANYSILLLVTEDHVTGDSFDYRQANNYADNAVVPMAGWENLANPASGNDIEFSHTLRAALGGFSGLDGIIPSTLASGETYTSTQTYTVPGEFELEELNIVAVVIDQENDGVAYNAHVDRDIEILTSSVDEITNLSHFKTFPNPVGDNVNIELGFSENVDFQMNITDALGKKVKSLGQYSESTFRTSVDVSDLPSGIYSLLIMTKDGQNVSKFVKM